MKLPFLAQAKGQTRYKIAMLLPVTVEYLKGFQQHDSDQHFPLKAIYSFPQAIGWLNMKDPGGKMYFAWFVFDAAIGDRYCVRRFVSSGTRGGGRDDHSTECLRSSKAGEVKQ